MSGDKRTLLFIGPKNPILEEVRPQLEDSGIYNIHETTFKSHDSQEIVKYLPWVIVFTDARECSKFMNVYGNVIKKTESKIILVTEKEASKKILHANLRFKLSEYLYGDVKAKTLMHKIQFQVRSLPNISNDDLQKIATTSQHLKEITKADSGPKYEVETPAPKDEPEGPQYEFGPSKKKEKVVPHYESAPVQKKKKQDVQVSDIKGEGEASEAEIKKKAQEIGDILGVSASRLKIGKNLEEESRMELDQEKIATFYEDNFVKVTKLEEVFDGFEVEFEDKSYLAQANFLLNDLKESSLDAGFHELALFCELARAISMRLSVVEDESFGVVVIGILFNTAEFIKSELEQIKSRTGAPLRENPNKVLFNRFHWIETKFESIEAPPGQHFPNLGKIMLLLGI